MKVCIQTDKAVSAIGPYSQAVKAGDFLFTSGQIPFDTSGQLVPGGVEEQAHQVFKNLKAVLEEGGASFAKVVKATVFLKDMNDFVAVNGVYAQYFDGEFPARAAVEVARLPKDVMVEIEMIAYLG